MSEDEEVDKPEEETGADNGDEPPPGEGLSEEVFVVAKILEHMIDMDGVLFFKVRWENYGPADDSWEPADNLASAKERIEEYWVQNKTSAKKPKSKKVKEKKITPKQIKPSGSSSRSRGRKSSPKVERKNLPETEPESEASDKSESEDDDSGKKRKSKPVSKGALKSFDTPRRSLRKDKTPPLSTAKKAALANRKTWLDSDSDDSDEEPKNEEKEKESDSVKKEAQFEENLPKSSKKSKRGREETPREDEDEPSSKRDKKEDARPPTPPKPSRYGQSSSSGTPPPENIEYVEPDEEETKIVKMKIKLPQKPSARTCFKSKEKTTSDILYYNRWKKYKPLSEIKGLKDIDIVEGIMISEKGAWKIFVRDVDKTCCILTAEEAYEMCGWTLVQFLLARAKFC